MHDYQSLRSYQTGRDIAEEIYRFVHKLLPLERYGLAQQMRRASVSVPANIAEGAGLGSPKDFARFLRIAIGSACEVQAHIDLAVRPHSIDRAEAGEIQDDLRSLIRRINALERKLQEQQISS